MQRGYGGVISRARHADPDRSTDMTSSDLTVTIKTERGWLEHAVMRTTLREIADADPYSWQGMLARDALGYVDDGEELEPER